MNGISRIYTEDIHRERIKAILEETVNGATLSYGEGLYHGTWEKSLIIRIFDIDRFSLATIAGRIGASNNQQTVIITLPNREIITLNTGGQHMVNGLVVDDSDVEAETVTYDQQPTKGIDPPLLKWQEDKLQSVTSAPWYYHKQNR